MSRRTSEGSHIYSGARGHGRSGVSDLCRWRRIVAIKVLPEHVATDPDVKQRFEREAKTISSLNHPHTCTLFDIGSPDGIDFLVMEYLPGLVRRLVDRKTPLLLLLWSYGRLSPRAGGSSWTLDFVEFLHPSAFSGSSA